MYSGRPIWPIAFPQSRLAMIQNVLRVQLVEPAVDLVSNTIGLGRIILAVVPDVPTLRISIEFSTETEDTLKAPFHEKFIRLALHEVQLVTLTIVGPSQVDE